MTLIYKNKEEKCTLEELIKKENFISIWDDLLIDEYKFWHGSTLDDIIAETSDAFEEVLEEKGYEYEYIKTDEQNFDYNFLLNALRDFSIRK